MRRAVRSCPVVTRNSLKNGHRTSTTVLDRLTRGTNKKMRDDGQEQQDVRLKRRMRDHRRAPKRTKMAGATEPQVRIKRVASLNAMAKVHILYENEARSSPNTSAGSSSGTEETPMSIVGLGPQQQQQQPKRRKKSVGATSTAEPIAAVTPKRMASLNAVAILAASYCPDWARGHRPALASLSMTKGKKGSKEGKDEMPGKEKAKEKEKERGLAVALTRCKKSRRRKDSQLLAQQDDLRPLSKVTRAATRDAIKFDDNPSEERHGHHHHHHHHHLVNCAWTDHDPVKTEAVKMVSEGDCEDVDDQGERRLDAAEVTITGMYINPNNNTSQSFCISRVHCGRKHQEESLDGKEVNELSPTPVQQMQHGTQRHLAMHAGNVIFHHQAPTAETCVNLGVGMPIVNVNVPLPRHFRSAFSVPQFGRHGTLSYTHGYFQPAGPLIQTLPETCLIHKPIPFHPHTCPGDPSANGTQSSAPYFASPPPTPVHSHGRCKRKHEESVFSVPVTCPVKVEPPRPPDSPPPSSAGSLSPSQSPSISPPSSMYVRAGVGSGRALRVAVKVEDVLHQGYANFSRVPSVGHRNRVFLHRHRVPRLCSNLSLSSSVSSSASSTSSNLSASSLTFGDARLPAHFAASPASKRPFPSPSSPSSTCSSSSLSKRQIPPRHSNGWMWDGEPFQSQVTLHNDDPPVSRTCYPSMRHAQGDVIRSRDCVLLKSGPRKNDLPFVAKVTELWEDPEDGEMMVSLLWYYRPEHTEQGRRPTHMDDEIFASKHYDVNSVACIEDKCYVLTFNEYCRYRGNVKLMSEGIRRGRSVVPELDEPYGRSNRQPPGRIPEDLVFFCRRVYDFRQKRLLKNPS